MRKNTKDRREPSPFFSKLVDHIDSTWFKKKMIHYPFQGRDFKNLKNYCRSFQEWGVAALWDNFISNDSEWVKKSGYSLGAFFQCLPWLVDTSWKSAAAGYQKSWEAVPPKKITEFVEDLFNKKNGGTKWKASIQK